MFTWMSHDAAHDFRGILRRHTPIPLSDEQIITLERHYTRLLRWNKVINLTTIRDPNEMVIRHYCESLFVAAHLPAEPLRIADLGSGPGFPGFPVAVVRPDCEITLIESHRRKAVFLREVSREIPNITVIAKRAEDVDLRFDWVISRAVRLEEVLSTGLASNYALLVGSDENGILLPWGKNKKLLVCST